MHFYRISVQYFFMEKNDILLDFLFKNQKIARFSDFFENFDSSIQDAFFAPEMDVSLSILSSFPPLWCCMFYLHVLVFNFVQNLIDFGYL